MRHLLSIFMLVALASCSDREDVATHSPDEEIFGARFKHGKGVELSTTMREAIDLQTVEAREAPLKGRAVAAALVPASAILTTPTGTYVYVKNGAHFLRTEVTMADRDEHNVEVADGLYSGDVVVKSPVHLLWYTELQAIRGGQSCADEH